MLMFLGVDGGGSKTTALIADVQGHVVGRGESGATNYHTVGVEAAFAALDVTVNVAMAQAGCTAVQVRAICLGMAGAGRPEDQAVIREWSEMRFPGAPAMVTHDAELVLAAGTPDGWGIAVLSGTGSLIYGRRGDGSTARAGGWGYLLGDEGSGYAIGLAALRAVARAADGRGPATVLTARILAHWSLSRPSDLVGYVYQPGLSRRDIAALSPLVQEAAVQGDTAAQDIVSDAGHELAWAIAAVMRQLALDAAPCALAGGVLVQGEAVRRALQGAVQDGLCLHPWTSVEEPAQGAIRLAARLGM